MDQVELMMEAEELRGLLKDRRMKKVLAFLEAKKAEVVRDWLEGNYPADNPAEVGLWTLTMAAQCQAYTLMLTLANSLPRNEQPQ